MRLLNPSGLWLLLGIPILIIIYLIKSQHEDTSVSSTYIWKLSSKFMKKKLPMQKLKKILVFVLQLMMIICAALMVARPAIDNGNAKDYIAIIDASASMNIADEDGKTRFDRALSQVNDMTDVISQGHKLTVIMAGEGAYFAVRESASVSETKIQLNKVSCGMGSCDIESAMELAQDICDYSNDYEVVFFTDAEPAEIENVSIVNLNENEWNVSIDSVKAVKKGSGTEFRVDITSFNKDADVAVGLKIDGKIVNASLAECLDNEPTSISIMAENVTSFETAEIYVDEKDGLAEDNTYFVCPKKSSEYKVLLASKSPLYIRSALEAMGNCQVDVVSIITGVQTSNYDLVIYDHTYSRNYTGTTSILQFGAKALPSGVTAGETIEEEGLLKGTEKADSSLYENMSFDEDAVSQYTELIGNDEWQPILTAGDRTVGLTSLNDNGAQITVLGFDLHDSNLPLKTDFTAMMKNLVEYSAPYLVKRTDYSVGENVTVMAIHDAESLYVVDSDGYTNVLTLTEDEKYTGFVPEKPGLYTAALTNESGAEYANFFVHVPEGEVKGSSDAVLKIANAPADLQNANDEDAVNEIWMYFAGLILLLLLVEWGIYYYEQR